MYNKALINKLAKRYATKRENDTFTQLLQELTPIIDIQLGKNYSSLKEYWDDLRQDVLLKLWENRFNIKKMISAGVEPCQFLYERIRTWLNRASAKNQREYDALNPDIMSIEEEEIKHLFY